MNRLNSLLLATFVVGLVCAQDESIRWLVEYDGKTLPSAPWSPVGELKATLEAEGLRLVDDSEAFGYYRAAWQPSEDDEIIVEATVQTGSATGVRENRPSTSLWPWRDGAPVMVQVSNGKHQEGLVLFPAQATTFTDRFIPMATGNRLHTYRLIIRGQDMRVWVDGQPKVQGQGAFWKPADSPEAFIQFGSSAERATGDALWASVRLGVRKPTAPLPVDPVKITVSPAWEIPRQEVRQTRPYLYDMGKGLLLMSVAQGPDAFYEPYGLLKSTDEGQTWTAIPGLDQLDTTPLPVLRRPDGSILAMSRWTWMQPDGSLRGKTIRLNEDASDFTMEDNTLLLPQAYTNEVAGDQTICERHLWNDDDGGVTMVLWTRKGVKDDRGRIRTTRWSHLMRSVDEGKTWTYFSTIGPGGEPAVVRLNATEQTAVIRGEADFRMRQVFSQNGGKTWSEPTLMEEGRVLPDLVLMSNGILACSYGRPASCIMFSLDGGKTWPSHHVISDKVGYNYTSIREIRPGRLLYFHDAPQMNGLNINVERR